MLIGSPQHSGQATTVLAQKFQSATGVDPSAGMVATARESMASDGHISFVQSKAEELSFLEDESVDLVTAGMYPSSEVF